MQLSSFLHPGFFVWTGEQTSSEIWSKARDRNSHFFFLPLVFSAVCFLGVTNFKEIINSPLYWAKAEGGTTEAACLKRQKKCTHANVLTWKLKPVKIWDNICNSQALFFIANQCCRFDLNWLTFGLLALVCNVLFIILAACWSHHFVRSPAQGHTYVVTKILRSATAFIQMHWSTGQ